MVWEFATVNSAEQLGAALPGIARRTSAVARAPTSREQRGTPAPPVLVTVSLPCAQFSMHTAFILFTPKACLQKG